MTRNRSLKRVVRARMAQTGESYSSARARLLARPRPQPTKTSGGPGMYPFERFTERAKKVLTLAQEEAEQSRHHYIGTEHLLLGLLREREGLAAKILKTLKVNVAEVRRSIAATPDADERADVQPGAPTSRIKKVIELAFDEARQSGHQFVGSEHLLIGILAEGHGAAAQVLVNSGVTLEAARTEMARLYAAWIPETSQKPKSRERVQRRTQASREPVPKFSESTGGYPVRCSFCGKSQEQVRKIVAGPDVYICDQCVELSYELVSKEDAGAMAFAPGVEEVMRRADAIAKESGAPAVDTEHLRKALRRPRRRRADTPG